MDSQQKRESLFSVGLVMVLCLAGFFYLSLWSFSPIDGSPYSLTWPHESTKNLGGKVGAFISAFTIYHFGALSLLLPLPFIWGFSFRRRFAGKALFLLALSCFTPIFLLLFFILSGRDQMITWQEHLFSPGGALGVTIHRFLEQFFGKIGTFILLGGSCAIAGFFLIKQPFLSLPERSNHRLSSWFAQSLAFAFAWIKTRIFHRSYTRQKLPSLFPRELPDVRPLDLLKTSTDPSIFGSAEAFRHQTQSKILQTTFASFGVEGEITGAKPGPVVTVYEFSPKPGTKLGKIHGLAEELALSLQVPSVLVKAIPEKSALGIQVPNKERKTVLLGDLLKTTEFERSPSPLTYALGVDPSGNPVIADLIGMPHLLIAGATGSGKSVGLNTLICSVIAKSHPEILRLILIDPKLLELSVYNGLPHLLRPVVTSAKETLETLRWLVDEMNRRYTLLQTQSVRNISSFNTLCREKQKAELPYILVVIDEVAELMLACPKKLEEFIQSIAQKARACGIHLVLATQRPSVDVLTGKIKANLPSRIAFQVASRHDSKTILESTGAEYLLGKGDLLFQRPGHPLMRMHGAFISDEEIQSLVAHMSDPRK